MDLIQDIFIHDISHPVYDPWRGYTDLNFSYIKNACPKQNGYRDFTWDQFCRALGLDGAIRMMGEYYCRFDSYKHSVLCRTYREMIDAFNQSRKPKGVSTDIKVAEQIAVITPAQKQGVLKQIKKKPKEEVTNQLF